MAAPCTLAVIGAGNIGRAIALGLVESERMQPGEIVLTRRRLDLLDDVAARGFQVTSDNREAVRRAQLIVIAVEPQQLDGVLDEIAGEIEPDRQVLVSVVSGASIAAILARLGTAMPVVRAMPNTAVALRRSMTCLAATAGAGEGLERVRDLFDAVGETLVIDEELMVPATALCACGAAFFLRAVRAASQGGIEIGFHPEDALRLAAQTALGAAALVLQRGRHPEYEIDRVTTPRGCTIAGLNEMEHHGFSSALIRGIVVSADKARALYQNDTA